MKKIDFIRSAKNYIESNYTELIGKNLTPKELSELFGGDYRQLGKFQEELKNELMEAGINMQYIHQPKIIINFTDK